ncbi:helix-turn-helix domain-containing protein [Planctomycetota bacterium]|nr:helix-turn-helix domain-containing protein [Planctomycetota bacterium]
METLHLSLAVDDLPFSVRCSRRSCLAECAGDGELLISIGTLSSAAELALRCPGCRTRYELCLRPSRVDLLTREEVGKLLRLSASSVDRRVRAGDLAAVKLGAARNAPVRFKRHDVELLLGA